MNELEGAKECLAKLQEIAGDNGKFVRYSIRAALRDSAKMLQPQIRAAITPGPEGILRESVKVRAGKRSSRGQSILVGIFKSLLFGKKEFYAGFENYGHKNVPGSHWTTEIDIMQVPARFTKFLRDEIEAIAKARGTQL